MKLKRWTVKAYTDTEAGAVRLGHHSDQGAYWTLLGAAREALRLDGAQQTVDTIFDPSWIYYKPERR